MREKIKNNTGTMYLIQRKEDGLFYKNGGGYYDRAIKNQGWSEKVSDCRPFRTIGGAKTSSGWNDWKTIMTDDACEECKNSRYTNHNHEFSERYFGWNCGRRARNPNVQTWIDKHNRKPCFHTLRMSEEENPRRIVPVRIQLALV